jgi:hypothetical protein
MLRVNWARDVFGTCQGVRIECLSQESAPAYRSRDGGVEIRPRDRFPGCLLRDRLEHLLGLEVAPSVAGIEIGKDLSGFRVVHRFQGRSRGNVLPTRTVNRDPSRQQLAMNKANGSNHPLQSQVSCCRSGWHELIQPPRQIVKVIRSLPSTRLILLRARGCQEPGRKIIRSSEVRLDQADVGAAAAQ